MEPQNLFANLRVNITAEEKIYTSVHLSGLQNIVTNMKDLVKVWDNQLIILSTIANTQPQATYLAFASGFKSNLYFLRTIPNNHHRLPPVERTIRNKFIPVATGCDICSDKERVLISLLTTYCGLTIPIFHEIAEIEFMDTNKITFNSII